MMNMFTRISKPIRIFLISVILISIPLFIFPINIFKGMIIYKSNIVEVPIKTNLSLSYFIGLGYDDKDLEGIKEFYLLPEGYFFCLVVLIGIPGLLAYRMYLKGKDS